MRRDRHVEFLSHLLEQGYGAREITHSSLEKAVLKYFKLTRRVSAQSNIEAMQIRGLLKSGPGGGLIINEREVTNGSKN